MMTAETLLLVMLAQPVWHQDTAETPAERADLLRPVAMAIELATDDATEQAALIALGYAESRWARYVVEGRCQDGPRGVQCDHGRARGPWQTWRVACPEAFELVEWDPRVLERTAKCAVRHLRGGYGRCRGRNPAGDWAGAFAAQRGGASCLMPSAEARQKTMRNVLLKLDSYADAE